MPTLGDTVYIHSSVDTASLKELTEASLKLYHGPSHGKMFCWIDSAATFAQTALFSSVRLVIHAALTFFSILGCVTKNGRAFLAENLVRSVIDLTAIVIGVVGTLSPWTGHNMTAGAISLLNRYVLQHDLFSENLQKEMDLESPVWLCRFAYQYSARMSELVEKEWGGLAKLQHKKAG